MQMPIRDQMKWWGIAAAVLILLMWFLNKAITPFIAGAAIAYFLDPVADRLERMGTSRVVATLIISFVALLTFVLAALILIPTLIEQTIALVRAAPGYTAKFQAFLEAYLPSMMEPDSILRTSLNSISENFKSQSAELAGAVFASAFGLIDVVVFLVVVPVVSFYMLLDWDRLISTINGWLPREHAPVIRDLANQVDRVLAGFVRGQLSVCLVLGLFYAALLMLVGLQFGLVVGLFAGLISFIPYIGALFGGVLAIGLALFQFWSDPMWILAVAAIFAVGQILEGNILSPNMVGKSVGLHPVWLMFSLAAFSALFGFAGMLVAVPVAATLGVFFRFGISEYLASPLYRGPTQPKTKTKAKTKSGT